MKRLDKKNLFSLLGLLFFLILAVGSVDENKNTSESPEEQKRKFIDTVRICLKNSNELVLKMDGVFGKIRKGYRFNELELYEFFKKTTDAYLQIWGIFAMTKSPDDEDCKQLWQFTGAYLLSIKVFCENMTKLLETGSLKSGYECKEWWNNVLTAYTASNLLFTKMTGENLMLFEPSKKKITKKKRKKKK